MSGKAFGWAREQTVSGGFAAKAVLLLMADYAGVKNELFPSVATMAAELQTTDRTVQRALKTLEDDGLIERELRTTSTGKKTSSRYVLRLEQTRHSVTTSPDGASPSDPTQCHHQPDTVSPSSLNLCSEPSASDEARDARAQAAFELLFEAWLKADPERTSRPRAWAAFAAVVEGGVDAESLKDVGLAYLADARRGKPKELHWWLKDGLWEGPMAARAARTKSAPEFADAAIRKAVAGAKDEAWTRAWLDPAEWRRDQHTIVAFTKTAGDELRRSLHWLWPKLGVVVADPERTN